MATEYPITPNLARDMAAFPSNYHFEIPKSVARMRQCEARILGLQMPEGLLMYATMLSDCFRRHVDTLEDVVIMADVTYGACCVDDYSARAMGVDFLIHYGHSCLVPINVTGLNMLYVFVTIDIDVDHLCRSIQANFQREQRIVLAGTVQFINALYATFALLKNTFPNMLIPQAKPLSKGETLGCTSPRFDDVDVVVFVADGRFHLESMMIHNEHVKKFFKYDPYTQKLTLEHYDHASLHMLRKAAIAESKIASVWGLILGTLGRQGNAQLLERLQRKLNERGIEHITVLLSEVTPQRLEAFSHVQCWVQIACPRLSIDWGHNFKRPLLNTYEAEVALNDIEWQSVYPMDYYASNGGPWSNYHERQKLLEIKRATRLAAKAAHSNASTGSSVRKHITVAYDADIVNNTNDESSQSTMLKT